MLARKRFYDKGTHSECRLKRPPRRRFRGNQHVGAEGVSPRSTSEQKLRKSKFPLPKAEPKFKYVIMEFFSTFEKLSNIVKCKACDGDVSFAPTKIRGLGFKLEVRCARCEPTEIDSGPFIRNGFEINSRITFAMRLLGVGYSGLRLFCGLMDFFEFINVNAYHRLSKRIAHVAGKVADEIMNESAREEQRLTQQARVFQDARFVSVSVDGSWAKRGFTSLFGLVAVIGDKSNKVIDVCVKSLYCNACAQLESRRDEDSYVLREEHESECDLNHQGSSKSMEASSALELFQRSVESRALIYKNFIGDGDSNAHAAVVNSCPYGDNIRVVKKECVGHVSKRMGTRLRRVYKENPSLRRRGSFNLKEIGKLTKFYGHAIRSNPESVSKMKDSIWATFYHRISTDELPQHHLCPSGSTSWCAWQRAKAEHEEDEYMHPAGWSVELQEALKPIYTQLSSDELLERCLGSHTQNNNESLHSTVWRLCPKTRFFGRRSVETAVNIAICTFNEGRKSLSVLMRELQCTVGEGCRNELRARDEQRVWEANERSARRRSQSRGSSSGAEASSLDELTDVD